MVRNWKFELDSIIICYWIYGLDSVVVRLPPFMWVTWVHIPYMKGTTSSRGPLCFAIRRILHHFLLPCVCTVKFPAPLELLIITLFLPIIYTFCIVNSIAYLLYPNAHSYRSLVFIFHFLAMCRVL